MTEPLGPQNRQGADVFGKMAKPNLDTYATPQPGHITCDIAPELFSRSTHPPDREDYRTSAPTALSVSLRPDVCVRVPCVAPYPYSSAKDLIVRSRALPPVPAERRHHRLQREQREQRGRPGRGEVEEAEGELLRIKVAQAALYLLAVARMMDESQSPPPCEMAALRNTTEPRYFTPPEDSKVSSKGMATSKTGVPLPAPCVGGVTSLTASTKLPGYPCMKSRRMPSLVFSLRYISIEPEQLPVVEDQPP
ncbi:hypothetical protein F5Y19DRAFT_474817 [Xylariaceae sp. FL1651]|nr:hypothetical protein F5Y19DRAFT_474817 [Xylariaceae sp. FL1651]